eukprot:942029-Prorocentrum_minimum.AAC.3
MSRSFRSFNHLARYWRRRAERLEAGERRSVLESTKYRLLNAYTKSSSYLLRAFVVKRTRFDDDGVLLVAGGDGAVGHVHVLAGVHHDAVGADGLAYVANLHVADAHVLAKLRAQHELGEVPK